MRMNSDPRYRLLVFLSALFVLAGCAGDEPLSPVTTGTIQVESASEAPAASWVLTGPDSFRAVGEGAETFDNMALGTYTIAWDEVAGWMAAASVTRELTANAVLAFGDVFAPLGGGTVVINGEPNEPEVPWRLLGPKGLSLSGLGDVKLLDMVPGDYWVSWGPIDGWEAPAGYSQTLDADDLVTFDGVYIESPPHPALPFAGTEDQLMANFRAVYEDRNIVSFPALMHPDFVMLLRQSTIQEFPDVGPTLDFNEELRIADRMFSGEPVIDPDGALVQAVSGISFWIFERLGPWEDTPDSDPIPQTRSALYDVTVLFDRPGASTLKVEGMMKFYVAGRDSLHEGTEQVFYEMKGQLDLTGGPLKAVETVSFGSVKALFR